MAVEGGSAAPPEVRPTGRSEPPSDDWGRLAEFVESLKILLATTLSYPYLVEPYESQFRDAWPSVIEWFGEIEGMLADKDPAVERGLEAHGLTGVQLTLKLALYDDARVAAMAAFERLSSPPDVIVAEGVVTIEPAREVTRRDRLLGKLKRVKKYLVQALPIGDKIVGSIGDAVAIAHPAAGAAASGIDEFKTMVESALRWRRKRKQRKQRHA
jgi:hypothetical protein